MRLFGLFKKKSITIHDNMSAKTNTFSIWKQFSI